MPPAKPTTETASASRSPAAALDPMPTGADASSDVNVPTTPAAPDKQPSKAEAVLKLLRRKRGASLAELQAATGWQAHSVRGFLSGTIRKRMRLALTAEPGSDGVRRYAVAKG